MKLSIDGLAVPPALPDTSGRPPFQAMVPIVAAMGGWTAPPTG